MIALSDAQLSPSTIAKQAALHPSGVAKACAHLEESGLLESVGRGRGRLYRLLDRSGMADALRLLFRAEEARVHDVLGSLREVCRTLPVIAAWIQGPVARGTDTLADPICFVALVHSHQAGEVRVTLRDRLSKLEQRLDLEVDWRIITRADLHVFDAAQLAELQDVVLLAGIPPTLAIEPDRVATDPTTRARVSHEELDRQKRALGHAIAKRLQADPSIRDRARRSLERWRAQAGTAGLSDDLREWLDILTTYSVPRLRRFLGVDSERARRLRQSMPFAEALDEVDRQAVLRESQSATE